MIVCGHDGIYNLPVMAETRAKIRPLAFHCNIFALKPSGYYIYIYIYIYIYVCVCVCVCVYTYIYIYI